MTQAQDAEPRLAFKHHLTAEVVPGEGVFLVSERGVTVLRGTGVTELAPLLDGSRTLDQLAAEAPGGLFPAQVRQVVGRLLDSGLLTCRPPAAPASPSEAFWELAGLDGPTATRRTEVSTVAVASAGTYARAVVAEMAAALTDNGLRLHRPGEDTAPPSLAVVLCDSYLDPELADLDAAYRSAGTPWLLVRLMSEQPWIGPVFRPDDGPCWHCLAEPLRRNRPAEAFLGQALGRPVRTPPSALAAGRAAGLHLACLEAVKWLAGQRHPGQNALWTLNPLDLTSCHHGVRRRPQCPACGDPKSMAHQVHAPFVCVSRPKTATGTGERSLTAEEMLRKYGHLVDDLTGVVKEIRRDRRGPGFLNCFHSGHNPAAAPTGLAQVRSGLRSHSSGKGTTETQAKVSALCEAVERHSGWFQGDEPTVRAAYRDVAGQAVHPDTIQLFHPRQYAGRARWNAAHGPAHRVCDPFDEQTPVDWTPMWSLTGGRHRLVPTAMLYYNAPGGKGPFAANSNGSAAGSSREDAVVQGFLELVERDAVALWWYNRTRQPGVDLDAFDDTWVRRVREEHRGLARRLWVLDLTSDLGVPVFAALSARTDKPAQDITLGFGAHFDPGIALRRAVAELNQMLPPVAGAGPDGNGYSCDDPAVLSWWRTATTANQPYLLPGPDRRAHGPGDFGYLPRTDLADDVAFAAELARGLGSELLVLDQTRPDTGLPVVKTVVPGLRPFWARFGPGRLYDVPVRLGRRSTPIRYEDLNPVPLFL
ncbi:TOMM precursor leader peptide-binding protein [Streptomyces actinomycinicus]|uniref:TOMM leader peptide-binding protein n=1 Tax=Streptomyces actinomycinicus TaxID=1695166 RepID=A0A937EQB5_9ACTN|nr:TOMM precursor leader peptide-binding protein [Streptomyces actinomycinicus]MBL1087603.1 TOMM precursor leader peptide-binding protein [Streptomyces actinomycinicus]